MARYPLNLPQQLKQEAKALAQQQGISLNQFILWATAEKVGAQVAISGYPTNHAPVECAHLGVGQDSQSVGHSV